MPAWAVPLAMGLGSAAGGWMGGKNASKPQTTYTNQSSYTTPFGGSLGTDYLNFILGQGMTNFFNPPSYPTVAPPQFHFNLGDALNTALGQISGWGSHLLGTGRRYIDDILTTDLAENPYFQELSAGVSDQAVQNFRESTVPFQRSRFSSAGRLGSGLAELALGKATTDFNRDLDVALNALATQSFDIYNQARTAAAGMIPSYEAARLAPVLANLDAQMQLALQRNQARWATQNVAYQDEFNRQQFNENLASNQLATLADLALPIFLGFGTTHTSGSNVVPGASVNPWGNALLSGLGGFSYGYGLQDQPFGSKNKAAASPPAPTPQMWWV